MHIEGEGAERAAGILAVGNGDRHQAALAADAPTPCARASVTVICWIGWAAVIATVAITRPASMSDCVIVERSQRTVNASAGVLPASAPALRKRCKNNSSSSRIAAHNAGPEFSN